MTSMRFDELLNDIKVYKTNHELDFQCTTACKRYSIGVYCNPPDFMNSNCNRALNKPFLGVFPSIHFTDLTRPVIKNEQIFLMFSECFEKAFTYRLHFDCDKGEAFLKVLDMPNTNDGIVTEREINGISKAIHPDLIKFLAPRVVGSFGY
ncbi:hypothetical protein G3O08_12010 [Cryomorpha ignava]|uniref:Uncharacterized protein n=1 Tax=Cryomorpha ignava TaxID=101383 RepID=A0A7K3WRC7_9FLAO|nr:hypothetical protein [Cryomorpha ignava]NEN24227.1 hypothetical protein [Cryomorpha ignava]